MWVFNCLGSYIYLTFKYSTFSVPDEGKSKNVPQLLTALAQFLCWRASSPGRYHRISSVLTGLITTNLSKILPNLEIIRKSDVNFLRQSVIYMNLSITWHYLNQNTLFLCV